MKSVNPYLNFAGKTAEAFIFYKSVFGGDFAGPMLRFRDFGERMMDMSESDLDLIAHVGLPINGEQILMGSDTPSNQPAPVAGSNFSILLEAESAEEAERVFNALAAGGSVEMPLMKTEWAEKYGTCRDQFGVPWMVNFTGVVNWEEAVQ